MKDPWHRNHLIRDAIGQAIYEAMKADPSIYLLGEGAHMKVRFDAPQVEKSFPERVWTMPISEDGSTNFAVGASLLGVKPIVDVITADFLYRAMDSICNTAAKTNFVSPDEPKTIIIRSEFLIGGPTTGQRPEALFVHIPGLNVALPSTPHDAYGLMKTALASPGVTLFFEDRMIRDAETRPEDCVINPEPIPLGQAQLRRSPPGALLTVVTYGLTRQVVESVLDQEALPVNLLDLRSLYPVDWTRVLEGARSTGRLLVVEPDITYGGIGAEIVARVAEEVPGATVSRLGAPRVTIPACPELHESMVPTPSQVRAAIKAMIG